MIISKNLNSLKHQNKAEFKNLDDSEVLSNGFSSLCDLCSLLDLTSLCDLNGLYSLKCLFSPKNFLVLMVGSSLAPKWPIWAPFCGMDHQKSNFSLISDTFSVGGCWGQPMLFFWKMVVVPKNSLFQQSRTIFKPNLPWLSLSVRAISIWDTL